MIHFLFFFLQFLFSKPVLESSNKKEQGMNKRNIVYYWYKFFGLFLNIYMYMYHWNKNVFFLKQSIISNT